MSKPLAELAGYYPGGKRDADSFGMGISASHPPAGGMALSKQVKSSSPGNGSHLDFSAIFLGHLVFFITTMAHPDLTQPV